MLKRPFGFHVALLATALLCGCATLGPQSIPRDRQGYSSAISDSWKEQTLLNIVRLRYADAPMFLDVSSIVASYSAEGQIDASATFPPQDSGTPSIGGYGRYITKPTISYAPLTGDKFTQSLLRPIAPASVFQMIQAGYPADFIIGATTRAINGHYNRSAGVNARAADPQFVQLTELLRRVQRAEGLGMRIERRENGEATVLFFRGDASPQLAEDVAQVRGLMGIRPSPEFNLVYGATPRNDTEIALLTRSMLEILLDFANCIDVPSSHVAEGRTFAGYAQGSHRLATIHSGAQAPADAYTAVRYRDTWYWVDDRDMASKRAFAFMMMFFSLAETGTSSPAPVLTIGAN
ncbi:hypothetical protein [Stenotrophomonas sp.]|uniref:hypothetical protein n=1 Tax=Stenotrophomonas sp. TaxID=69392 RepID=UPI0028B24965|nr:hypothetical protein [Stenotrophomonas sp.]